MEDVVIDAITVIIDELAFLVTTGQIERTIAAEWVN